jgi:hypothetical protein
MSAGSVGWPSFAVHSLRNIRGFIRVSSLMNVDSVGRPLFLAHSSLTTTELTLDRKPHMQGVQKAARGAHPGSVLLIYIVM